MKITGGKFKGVTISSVSDKRTRYTPAMVREALYDVIDASGKDVLELFGGSGVVSAEALSRDASKITIVEITRSSCVTIKKNIEKIHGQVTVMNVDFRIALRRLSGKKREFDIIFADPPFGTGLLFETFKELDKHFSLIKSNGIAIIESFEKELPPSNGENITLYSRRKYGDIALSLYKRGVNGENKSSY